VSIFIVSFIMNVIILSVSVFMQRVVMLSNDADSIFGCHDAEKS
jgi:preprotein translocase subunit SecG